MCCIALYGARGEGDKRAAALLSLLQITLHVAHAIRCRLSFMSNGSPPSSLRLWWLRPLPCDYL